MTETLAVWQPRYAERGVSPLSVVIPAEQKKPCIRGYLRTDVAHSAQFALASLDTKAFFPCGRGSRLTLFDTDPKDPATVGENERIFGELVWRTGTMPPIGTALEQEFSGGAAGVASRRERLWTQ